MLPVLHLQIGLRQLIVSLGKRPIHLGGVAELNGCLTVLGLGKIPLPAFEVLLFPHVAVARTSSQKSGQTSEHQDQTENRRTLHRETLQSSRLALGSGFNLLTKVLHRNDYLKVTGVTPTLHFCAHPTEPGTRAKNLYLRERHRGT